MTTVIDTFRGDYAFLSNFYQHSFMADGSIWPTSEHYYQSLKSLDYDDVEIIRLAKTAKDAKRLGRTVRIRPNWNECWRYSAMFAALQVKFTDPFLRKMLEDTDDAILVEGNTWHDNFWGVCRCNNCGGKGKNMLGIMLMIVRDS